MRGKNIEVTIGLNYDIVRSYRCERENLIISYPRIQSVRVEFS